MPKIKWYLSTWFIALMFALWALVIPLILGIIFLVLRIQEDKRTRQMWEECGFGDVKRIKDEIQRAKREKERILSEQERTNIELKQLLEEVQSKKQELIILDDEILYQSFGFYKPKFNFETSSKYKEKMEEIRNKQKEMVKNRKATDHYEDWKLDGDLRKGRAMNNDNIKLTLRAFNNECDVAIAKVRFNNIESIEKQIKKSCETLNKVNIRNRIEIKKQYLDLKLQELYLAYEYEQKKQEEKEEQRRIREQMQEEQRVLQEIEEYKQAIAKEETHFQKALTSYEKRLLKAKEEEREELLSKIEELKQSLEILQKKKQDVQHREQNTRAGYVYIISNIGSFGESIYKIGVTRRLEPMERIKELSNASVPFSFDVHAMIFSEDAPTLENNLHKFFHQRRVNKVNERKEFFRVSLGEIEEVVKKNHNKVVEFTKVAEAQQFRETVMLEKQNEEIH